MVDHRLESMISEVSSKQIVSVILRNSVGKSGAWAKMHTVTWRQNDPIGKAAESLPAILLTLGVQKGGVKSQRAFNWL